MDKLRAYLKANAVSQTVFAGRLGISDAFLSQIMSGKRRPSLDLAADIDRQTGGSVGVLEWSKRHPKQKEAAR